MPGSATKRARLVNERAYDQHNQQLAYVKTWPVFDGIRSEPRFQALLKKMTLAR